MLNKIIISKLDMGQYPAKLMQLSQNLVQNISASVLPSVHLNDLIGKTF